VVMVACVQLIFDGVTKKWRNAILLDAVICNYKGRIDEHFSRRSFDHHSCLKHCVSFAVYLAKKDNYVPVCNDVLCDIDGPWVSFEAFMQSFLGKGSSL
jgi:hypothetical protein